MPSISIINSMSWFVGYYFIVVLCGVLFLNKFLENLEIKRYTSFLITLLAVIQFLFSLEILDDLAGVGLSTVMTGIFLYSLGGFIKRFDPFKNVRLYVFFLVIIGVYTVIWISAYNETQTNIEAYIRSGRTDPFIQNISSYSNFSIVTIIISVYMFEVFRRIRVPENNFVSFLGKSTLMIYLIHDNAFFYQIWNLRDWITTLGTSPGLFLLNIFKWAGYTFVAGVCAYIAFVGLKWLFNKSRKLFTKISD